MFNEIILRQRNCVLLHMVWLYSGLKVPAQQYIIVMDTSTKRRKAKTQKRKALIQVEVRNFRICPKSETHPLNRFKRCAVWPFFLTLTTQYSIRLFLFCIADQFPQKHKHMWSIIFEPVTLPGLAGHPGTPVKQPFMPGQLVSHFSNILHFSLTPILLKDFFHIYLTSCICFLSAHFWFFLHNLPMNGVSWKYPALT